MKPRWAFSLIGLFAVLYFSVFLFLEIKKLRNYDVLSFDLVNLHIICSSFIEFLEGLDSKIYGAVGIVQHPMMGLPCLLWLVHPSTLWPILFTIGFVSAAIPILYLLAKDVLGGVAWPLLIALSFAFHPLTETLSLIGYQPTSQLIFWFFLEILLLRFHRIDLFTLALVCTNLSRVNGPTINLLLGIALILQGNRPYGYRAVMISLPWMMILSLLTHLVNRWSGTTFSTEIIYLSAYGETIQEALRNIIMHPGLLLEQLWTVDNLHHLFQFLPVLFVSFFSPIFLFPALIDLTYVFVSSSSLSTIPWMMNMKEALGAREFFHNNMMSVLPIIYVSAVFGLRRILSMIPPKHPAGLILMGLFVFVNAVHHYEHASPQAGPIPLSKGFSLHYYTKTKHAEIIDEIWREVPDGARIKAPWNLQGFHAPRMKRYYHFHYTIDNESYDYLFFDLFSFSYIKPRGLMLADIKQHLESQEFGVIRFSDGIVLMKRGATTERNANVLNFMEENRELLSRNLLNPYILGGSPWDRDGTPSYYSLTQRVR